MGLIEIFNIESEGYHPFLIRDGWQVAQLNYMPQQELQNIFQLDVHLHTDEVFVLLEGEAVLIGADINRDIISFEACLLQKGITYNIPQGMWHNIAMKPGCKSIIVERSDTHLSDFEHFKLTKEQKSQMDKLVVSEFERGFN